MGNYYQHRHMWTRRFIWCLFDKIETISYKTCHCGKVIM